VTPAGHRFYAIQWFAFAAIALLIFILAVRKRQRAE
jgi:cytochrome oxidase assembly protein ShyY1